MYSDQAVSIVSEWGKVSTYVKSLKVPKYELGPVSMHLAFLNKLM